MRAAYKSVVTSLAGPYSLPLGLNFALGLAFKWVLFAAGRQARIRQATNALV